MSKSVYSPFLTQNYFRYMVKNDSKNDAIKHKWDLILHFLSCGLCDLNDINRLCDYAIFTGRPPGMPHTWLDRKMNRKERNIYDEAIRWREYRHMAINNGRPYWKMCRYIRQRLIRMVSNYYEFICANTPHCG
jgi:hypothetical protein